MTIKRPYRVLVHGLYKFCEKLPALLGSEQWDVRHCSYDPVGLVALLNDLRRCDLVYVWGGRISLGKFLWTARRLGKTKLVQLWCGSDVLFARQQLETRTIDPWIAGNTHWAVSPTLADEVRELGLRCEYVQASFVDPVKNPKPLPAKFSVLTYLPAVAKGKLYGLDMMLEVASSLPSVEFNVIGVEDGPIAGAPPNFKVHSRLPVGAFLERSTVVWRPVRHDGGISFMVLEALAHGRHVLYSYPFTACTRVTGAAEARAEIKKLLGLQEAGLLELNRSGIDLIAKSYASDKVRADLLMRWEELITTSPRLVRRASNSVGSARSSSRLDASNPGD